jgi:hypothetical protein
MEAEPIHEVTLGDDELELMLLVVTTKGVHVSAFPVLGTVPAGDQAEVIRAIATQLRAAADRLEARAGLVDDIEEAMR